MPQALRASQYDSRPAKWMVRFITGLLLLLPFIYLPGFGSYTSLRYFVFGTIALILGILAASVWLTRKDVARLLWGNACLYGLFVYLCTFLLVSFTGTDPALSFLSTFQRTDGGATLIFTTLFSLATATAAALEGWRVVRVFLSASVFGATAFSVVLLCFPESGYGGATVGNSSLAGLYVVWNLFFALWLAGSSTGRRRIGWILSALLMLISPLFLSWGGLSGHGAIAGLAGALGTARGAMLGLLVGLLIALGSWLATDVKRRFRYVGRVLLVALIVGTCLAGVLLLDGSSALHRAFIDVATGKRFVFWDSALAGFSERPILGWGPGTFSEVYHRHFDPSVLVSGSNAEILVDRPHNLFFETLAGGGIILTLALCVYLAAIIWMLARLVRRQRLLGALLVGAFAAWLIQVQFVFDSPASLILLALAVGIALIPGALSGAEQPPRSELVAGRRPVLIAVVALSVALFVYAIVLPMAKAHTMYRVYNMRLPARADQWGSLAGISPMGDQLDSAIMFTGVYLAYEEAAPDIRKGDPRVKAAVLKEIDEINAYLNGVLKQGGEKYELMFAAANLYRVRLLIDPRSFGPMRENALALALRMMELSPADPRPKDMESLFEKAPQS